MSAPRHGTPGAVRRLPPHRPWCAPLTAPAPATSPGSARTPSRARRRINHQGRVGAEGAISGQAAILAPPMGVRGASALPGVGREPPQGEAERAGRQGSPSGEAENRFGTGRPGYQPNLRAVRPNDLTTGRGGPKVLPVARDAGRPDGQLGPREAPLGATWTAAAPVASPRGSARVCRAAECGYTGQRSPNGQ